MTSSYACLLDSLTAALGLEVTISCVLAGGELSAGALIFIMMSCELISSLDIVKLRRVIVS